jgi:DnaK suppressor protein
MDTRHARDLLARERARVERALAARTPPDSADVTDPFEASDVSSELLDEELGEARAEQLRIELDAIERAEGRLADGTYGCSVESGQPIPDARLEAVPWAERTAEEQARYEAQGR